MQRQTKHSAPLPFVDLDRDDDRPLYLQITQKLRSMILSGDIRAGQRLPSTRILMGKHSISRSTIVTAFEQLISEGYLVSKTGSGTYVNPELPGAIEQIVGLSSSSAPKPAELSKRGDATVAGLSLTYLEPSPVRPFILNTPAIDLFPNKVWGRIENKIRNSHNLSLKAYGGPRGYGPLRMAIADHVLNYRGIKCSANQVVVTSGTQRSLGLISSMLLNPGDEVLIEDPSSRLVQQSFLAQGLILTPVRVGPDGATVCEEHYKNANARLAYLSPSCQYPLGVAMHIKQRLDWVSWSEQNSAWIIEDDLDNEFIFKDRAEPAIFSSADNNRTIYVSSFNNTLFPSMRIGFMIAPPALAEKFQIANTVTDRGPSTWSQAVLAEFIQQGHFATHVRRMHAAYMRRRGAMIDSLSLVSDDVLSIRENKRGLRIITSLPNHICDKAAEHVLNSRGITALALSSYCLLRRDLNGLLLGFGCTHEEDIPKAIETLVNCLSLLPKPN